MTYCLEARYVKFITIPDDDLDGRLDEAFEELPITVGKYDDWELMDSDWKEA